MNQDQINRDRMLTEVHSDVKHIVEWSKGHDKRDDDRFETIDKDNKWRDKLMYGCVGVFVFVEFVARLIK